MAASVGPWTIGRLLETASGYLREKGSGSARLDAELLLAETLGLDRVGLYTEYDRPLTAAEVDGYRALVARRAAHEPVAYILGRAHFRRLSLEVGPAVLIPRPETEELVEVALELLTRRPPWAGPQASGSDIGAPGPPLIADVGTGSGAIALSLAQEAGVRVLATDSSADALAVAARNAEALGLEDFVVWEQTDLLSGVPDGSLHLVVGNPPYVTSEEMDTLAPDVRLYEPASALEAGPDGLDLMRRLVPEAARALRPGGSLLLEVGHNQAEAVRVLARDCGFALVSIRQDLSGKSRIVEATLPGASTLVAGRLDAHQLTMLRGALEAGAVVGIPTDTVYGLAARWDSAAGVQALFAAKGRPSGQTVAVAFASVRQVGSLLPDLEPPAVKVLGALLPGPYTFVVGTRVPRPQSVGTADSLGVRVPDHATLLELIAALGTPLAATSANRTGEKDPACAEEVDPVVLAHCSVALTAEGDDGVAGAASTVVDLRPLSQGGPPVVIREGAVPGSVALEQIAALGR